MKASLLRLGIVGVLGLLAPVWWTWAVGKLIYGLYVLGGSPERPSPFFASAVILIPSFLVGLIGGGIAAALVLNTPFRGWVVFAVSAILGTIISLFAVASLEALPELLKSTGTWSFAAGTLAVPAILQVIMRRYG